MTWYQRAWPALLEHAAFDPRSGARVMVPRTGAQRATLAFGIDGGRMQLHVAIERAAVGSREIVLHLARSYVSAELGSAERAALEAQLVRGLASAGYRERPASSLPPMTEPPPRRSGDRVRVAWSPIRPQEDAILRLVEDVLPVDASTLALGQPHDGAALEDVELDVDAPAWSLEAAFAVLAIAGHPTLRAIEIEETLADEGVELGDPALLFAALPRLDALSIGSREIRR